MKKFNSRQKPDSLNRAAATVERILKGGIAWIKALRLLNATRHRQDELQVRVENLEHRQDELQSRAENLEHRMAGLDAQVERQAEQLSTRLTEQISAKLIRAQQVEEQARQQRMDQLIFDFRKKTAWFEKKIDRIRNGSGQ